ncbi:alpha-L-glutamate ligase, RimK family protein [Calothrix brevissima NIES-22]|nr:alpha-L-glutamate ligase, RimK family protein [Calothrix brevissima NIES-22]
MRSIGICFVQQNLQQIGYETYQLFIEAEKHYERIIPINNPRSISYQFIEGNSKPKVILDGQDISNLDTLLFRQGGQRKLPAIFLAQTLNQCGCDILDSIAWYTPERGSKLGGILKYLNQGCGINTYIAFTRNNGAALLQDLANNGKFPLILKPVHGSQGRGIHVIEDLETGLELLDAFYDDEQERDEPFYLQEFLNIEKEYRVVVLDGKAIGAAQKIAAPGKHTANAAQGGTFVAADVPNVTAVTLENVTSKGLFGVDVAVDQQDNIRIIEVNRIPQWKAFSEATGINVAQAILENTLEQNSTKSALGILMPSNSYNLPYELDNLYKEAPNYYKEIISIETLHSIIYKFVRGSEKPSILMGSMDLSLLDTCIIRESQNSPIAKMLLVHALNASGCNIIDPVTHHSGGAASKLGITLRYFRTGLVPSNYVVFNRTNAINLLEELVKEGQLPLISKDILGSQGQNVDIITDISTGMQIIEAFYQSEEEKDYPFYLQTLIQIEKEYRIMLLDGKAIGIAEKILNTDRDNAKTFADYQFCAIEALAIAEKVIPYVSPKGLLGVDIAVDFSGDLFILDVNREPVWYAFEQTTGVNVAAKVIERGLERLADKALPVA